MSKRFKITAAAAAWLIVAGTWIVSSPFAGQDPIPGPTTATTPIPLPPGQADYAPTIQAAIDALPPGGGAVELPAGPIPLGSSLRVDRSGVTLRGRGKDTILQARGYFHPIVLGVPRDAALTADHRFDLFGTLDATVAPVSGQAWGVDLKGDRWLSWWAMPPASGMLGDGWRTVPALTIDLCLPTVPAGPYVALLAMGTYPNPSPWGLDIYTEPVFHQRFFRYWEQTAEGSKRYLEFGNADAVSSTPVRISLVRDLADGTFSAWVNGQLMPERTIGAPITPGANFAPNKVAPFQLGNGDVIQSDWRPPGWVRPAYRVAGLTLSAAIDYASDVTGKQVRADGGAIDDSYRYGPSGRNVIARLSLADPPQAGPAGQAVRMVGGPNNLNGQFWGMFLASGQPVPAGLSIENMSVQCQNGVGQGVAIGQVLDVTLKDFRSIGGYQGAGSLNVGAVYLVRILGDTRLSGQDCGYYGNSQKILAGRLDLGYVTNAGVRLAGCDASFDALIGASYARHPSCLAECLGGGYAARYSFGELWVDNEGGKTEPAVVCEKHPAALTTLDIGALAAGTQDGVTPMIDLRDAFPGGGINYGGICLVRGPVRHTTGLVVGYRGDWSVDVSGTSPWPNASALIPSKVLP